MGLPSIAEEGNETIHPLHILQFRHEAVTLRSLNSLTFPTIYYFNYYLQKHFTMTNRFGVVKQFSRSIRCF